MLSGVGVVVWYAITKSGGRTRSKKFCRKAADLSVCRGPSVANRVSDLLASADMPATAETFSNRRRETFDVSLAFNSPQPLLLWLRSRPASSLILSTAHTVPSWRDPD